MTCGPHIHDRAVGKIDADVEVGRFRHHRRTRYVLQRDRLFFGDGFELVPDHLEGDRIDRRAAAGWSVMTRGIHRAL